MKVLCLSRAPKSQASLLIKELSLYCEVDFLGNCSDDLFHWNENTSEVEFLSEDNLKNDYDIVLALDLGVFQKAKQIARNRFHKAQFGIYILDYPLHVFDVLNRTYSDSHSIGWSSFSKEFAQADFIIVAKKSSLVYMSPIINNVKSYFVMYPSLGAQKMTCAQENFLTYAGRLTSDKRMDAIFFLMQNLKREYDKKITLEIISSFHPGKDGERIKAGALEAIDQWGISDVVHLNANLDNASRDLLYNQSLFCVYAGYEWCPSGSVSENISIGHNCLCYYCAPDFLDYYGPNIVYGDGNIYTYCSNAYKMINDPQFVEQESKNRIQYFQDHCTYRVWGEKMFDTLKKVLND